MLKNKKTRFLYIASCAFLAFSSSAIFGNQIATNSMLPDSSKKEIVSKIFTENNKYNKSESVLMKEAVEETNLIFGKVDTPDMCLLEKINKTSTSFGYGVLRELIQKPTESAKTLGMRQAFIKSLVQDESTLTQYREALDEIGKNEDKVLSLWSTKSDLTNNSDMLGSISNLIGVSKSTMGTELVRMANISGVSLVTLISTLYPIFIILQPAFDCFSNEDDTNSRNKKKYSLMTAITNYAMPCDYSQFNLPQAAVNYSFLAIAALCYTKLIPAIRNQERNNKKIQDLMIGIATVIKQAKILNSLVAQSELAQAVLVNSKKLDELLNSSTKDLAELHNLLNQLGKSTFKSKPSFLSLMGRVRTAYKKTLEIKNQLILILRSIGEIDAYISMATLIKQSAGKNTQYCFTKFIRTEYPRIEITNGWNPVIGTNLTAVTPETVVLGAPEVPNMLLTGPHGGGKSTYMRMTAYVAILSQVFGVAPATECKMTIFKHINTYFDIRDNMQKGTSTFMAEGERLKKMKKQILALREGEFALNLIDEPCKGTAQKTGSSIVIKFGQKIASVTESLCIISSHFEEIVNELNGFQNGRFKAYRMASEEKTPGRFRRTFKVEPGCDDWWFDDANPKKSRYLSWLQNAIQPLVAQ